MADEARRVYESLTSADAIAALARERRQEDLHLDFKLISEDGNLTREDRKNLAKALSGFANSDGGVIIWGVDSRRDDDGVDAASEIKPCKSPERALTQINSLTGAAANPIVDGVETHLLKLADGSGFLVTIVPASDRCPHMAKQGEDRYYKRSGDSFYRMEHFDIEDMFGRRRKPVLELNTHIIRHGDVNGPAGSRINVEVVLGISNSGRAIARFPSLKLKIGPRGRYAITRFGLDGNGRQGLPMAPKTVSGMHFFAGGSDHVVHVDSTLEVTKSDQFAVILGGDPPPNMSIAYEIAAEGIQGIKGEATISGAELVKPAS